VANLLLLVGGVSVLINLTEPFAHFGRIEKHVLLPLVYGIKRGVAGIMELTGRYISIEELSLSIPGTSLGAATFILIFLLALFRGRFYCTTLCPTGALFTLPAAVSRFRISINPERCTRCGACEKVCKSGCLDSKNQVVDAGSCVDCFSCLQVCDYDAIHYRWVPIRRDSRFLAAGNLHPFRQFSSRRFARKPGQSAEAGQLTYGAVAGTEESPNRREFIRELGRKAFGLGVLLVYPAARLAAPARVESATGWDLPIIPPGSGSIERFFSRCIACHVCVSKCPEKVLVPAGFLYGLAGFEKPVLDFTRAHCEYECNVCSQICPSGAIEPIPLNRKKLIQIGKVDFIQDLCVVYKDGTACGACAEVCPTTAVFMVPYRDNLTVPGISPRVCTGCGACEEACPVEGQKAIFVRGRAEHGTAVVRTELPAHAVGGSDVQGGSADGGGKTPSDQAGTTDDGESNDGFAF
jgi:formate hydrogenlyase subunit 6/NADH:ubiquinone oxidoreductase subunit I